MLVIAEFDFHAVCWLVHARSDLVYPSWCQPVRDRSSSRRLRRTTAPGKSLTVRRLHLRTFHSSTRQNLRLLLKSWAAANPVLQCKQRRNNAVQMIDLAKQSASKALNWLFIGLGQSFTTSVTGFYTCGTFIYIFQDMLLQDAKTSIYSICYWFVYMLLHNVLTCIYMTSYSGFTCIYSIQKQAFTAAITGCYKLLGQAFTESISTITSFYKFFYRIRWNPLPAFTMKRTRQ